MKKQIRTLLLIAMLAIFFVACKNTSINPEQVDDVNQSIDIEKDNVDESNLSSDIEKDNMDENNLSNLPTIEKIYISEDAGYQGQELLRLDFKAKTHVEIEDMTDYYSNMVEKTSFTHSSQIPLELCEMIKGYMEQNTEQETLKALMIGSEISQEEFINITGFELENIETILAVRVDADNNGILDLIGQFYYGGTGGFSSMIMYKGLADGQYEYTNSFECLRQNFSFLQYQGKHYLLMEEFDYNTKYYSGYSLYLYEDGVLADGKQFYFVIDDYDMDIKYEDSSFEGLDTVKNTLSNKMMPDILRNSDGVIIGNAETVYKSEIYHYKYSSDIDNDGNQEYYNKSMWYPSNMGTVMMCIYDFENSNILDDLCAKLANEMDQGRLYSFWLDEVEGENILYLYFGNDLDFTLYGFLISKLS